MSFTYINREIYPKMLVQDEPLDDNYARAIAMMITPKVFLPHG